MTLRIQIARLQRLYGMSSSQARLVAELHFRSAQQ
jgi:hypothetical protein